MRRVYLVLDGNGKPFKKIKTRQPKNAPTSTHWVYWREGYFDYNPEEAGQVTIYDQAGVFPVKRLQ